MNKQTTLLRQLLRQVRPYRWSLMGLMFLSLITAPLALLNPLPLKIAVDSVIGNHPLPGFMGVLVPPSITSSKMALLLLAVGILVAIALLGRLLGLLLLWLRTHTGETMVRDFRAQLFRHLQRVSLTYHDSKGTMDSTYRIQYDAPAVQHIAVDGLIPLLSEAVTLIAMLSVAARIDAQLALVALLVTPALFWLARAYQRHLRDQWHRVIQLESSAFSVVQEVLSDVRLVKAFGQEAREQERFVRRASEGVWARVRVMMAAGGFGVLVGLITAVGMAAVLFLGVHHVLQGILPLGGLLIIMTYLAQLYGPLETISKKLMDLQASWVSLERSFSLLDQAPDVEERPHARPLAASSGAVSFRNVSFAYPNRPPVLEDISFDVTPGMLVGIVGITGSGKSTLMNLLTRFYDPIAGQILLDGVDLRDYKLADLRNQFAIVLQEPVLFSTSLAENIAYARPGANEEEILTAAKAANIHDFIRRLPKGYETPVGERGMQLSGGERQRISLARAFLKDAPILILDEPTSSVDTKTEASLMDAMEKLIRGRTTFIIAHRLSTLKNCDLQLRVEGGRLVATPLNPIPGMADLDFEGSKLRSPT